MEEKKIKSEVDIIQGLINKSEDEFEKKLTYIGAGALLLSLTLIEKILNLENSVFIFFIVLGWALLVFSLLVNLVSHLVSKIFFRKTQKEIRENIEYSERIKKYEKRLLISNFFNWSSLLSLILGIVFIIVFVSTNISSVNNKSRNESKQDTLNIRIINK